jgi:hypothetical protein
LLLGSEGNKTETTALARLVASLKLLDHETGDGAKRDLGRDRLIGSKEFLELKRLLVAGKCYGGKRNYLILSKIIW